MRTRQLAKREPTHAEQYTILGTITPMTAGTLPPRFTAQTSTVSSAFLSPRQRSATPPVSVPTAPTFPFDDQTVFDYTRTGTRSPFLRLDRAVSAPPQFPMDMDTVGDFVEARHTMDGDVDLNTPVGSPKSPMTDKMSYMNSPENLSMLSPKTLNMNRSGGGGDDDDGTETSTHDLSSTSSIGCSVLDLSQHL
jgi:hypothetical protein